MTNSTHNANHSPSGHDDSCSGSADNGHRRLGARARKVLAVGLLTCGGVGLAVGDAGAIVGGEPANTTDVPWQVSLQFDEEHGCGGSIVSPTQVVTAAHCLESDDPTGVSVLAGQDDLNDSGGQRVAVDRIVPHPQYARSEVPDLAVLTLESPLQFNGDVQPIALASSDEIASATEGLVSGWGATSETSEAEQPQLLSATVPMVDDATCDTDLGGIDDAAETCAGGTGTDSCYGDSGGPLAIEVDGKMKLAGVTSWGDECGGATPGVYAEVATFADFITSGGDTVGDFEPENAGSAGEDGGDPSDELEEPTLDDSELDDTDGFDPDDLDDLDGFDPDDLDGFDGFDPEDFDDLDDADGFDLDDFSGDGDDQESNPNAELDEAFWDGFETGYDAALDDHGIGSEDTDGIWSPDDDWSDDSELDDTDWDEGDWHEGDWHDTDWDEGQDAHDAEATVRMVDPATGEEVEGEFIDGEFVPCELID